MIVQIDGQRAVLCDGCGTRLDGMENINKSGPAYGTGDPETGRFIAKTHICRTEGPSCLWAWRGGLSEEEALAAYHAELAASPRKEQS